MTWPIDLATTAILSPSRLLYIFVGCWLLFEVSWDMSFTL